MEERKKEICWLAQNLLGFTQDLDETKLTNECSDDIKTQFVDLTNKISQLSIYN